MIASRCFLCTKDSVGVRVITHMQHVPLRHGPILLPHCADHAGFPAEHFMVEITAREPMPYPPDFKIKWDFKWDDGEGE